MSDPTTTPPARRQADGQISATTTAVGAMSMAGAVGLFMWCSDMLDRSDYVNPPLDVAAFIVACAAPFVHMIGRGVMHRLSRWAGDNQG